MAETQDALSQRLMSRYVMEGGDPLVRLAPSDVVVDIKVVTRGFGAGKGAGAAPLVRHIRVFQYGAAPAPHSAAPADVRNMAKVHA